MRISFAPAKNARNIKERGLSFERAIDFDFETATTFLEDRHGETRIVSVGYLDRRLHVICYVETANGIRAISFRKANEREAKKYGKEKTFD